MAKFKPKSKVKKKKKHRNLVYYFTPPLVLMLALGICIMAYIFTPVHMVQPFLNLIFLDNHKLTDVSDGLNIIEKDIKTDNGDGQTFSDGKITYPTFGEQYAVLSAESIQLTCGVFYGVNKELLERGACQSTQSPIIGEAGNTVIDAHVNTYFANLSDLKKDDEIILYTDYGNFTYKVKNLIAFDKNDKRYLTASDQTLLTLYTCQPQVIGSPNQRIGVQCEPVSMKFYAPN
ncbi:MAG: class D sortase [Oscillospiraceae bacterium]|nr:class D sortase [Oscillospiraceae bacterium]